MPKLEAMSAKHFFSRITFPSPSPEVPERVEFWIWRPDGSSIAMLSSGDPKQDEAEAAAMVEGLNQFFGNPNQKPCLETINCACETCAGL